MVRVTFQAAVDTSGQVVVNVRFGRRVAVPWHAWLVCGDPAPAPVDFWHGAFDLQP